MAPKVRRPKSRFEREKEEREARRVKEEKERAVVYEEFAASFEAGRAQAFGRQDRKLAGTDPEKEERKPRQIDTFLEELKSRQEDEIGVQTESAAVDVPIDDGNACTTNLYLGNLAPGMTEEGLAARFRKYGPIDSVKIMWPRSEEERSRWRLSGFISFFSRIDADEARQAMNDTDIDGYRMTVGWGKAVPRSFKHCADPKLPAGTASHKQDKIQVQRPLDPDQLITIDTMADVVSLEGGALLEAAVRDRELRNPSFAFLFQHDSPEAHYYRWRVYANLMTSKDKAKAVLPKEFRIQKDGPLWISPPPLRQTSKTDSSHTSDEESMDAEDEKKKRPILHQEPVKKADISFKQWQDILNTLTMSRTKIAEAMCFAYDRVESATDLSTSLMDALLKCDPSTSLAKRASWFCLMSDLLANAGSIRGSSRFKSILQPSLPSIVLSLSQAFRATSSRMAANTMETRIGRVLAFWLRRNIFPPIFVHGLEATFLAPLTCLPSVSRSDTDHQAMRRKARQAGIPDQGIPVDQIEARLRHARAYVKFRTLGAEPRLANEKALNDEASTPEPTLPLPLASDHHHIQVEHSSLDGDPFDAISEAYVLALKHLPQTTQPKETLLKNEKVITTPDQEITQDNDKAPLAAKEQEHRKDEAPPPRDSKRSPEQSSRRQILNDPPKRYSSRSRSRSSTSSSSRSSYSSYSRSSQKRDLNRGGQRRLPPPRSHEEPRRYSRSRSPPARRPPPPRFRYHQKSDHQQRYYTTNTGGRRRRSRSPSPPPRPRAYHKYRR